MKEEKEESKTYKAERILRELRNLEDFRRIMAHGDSKITMSVDSKYDSFTWDENGFEVSIPLSDANLVEEIKGIVEDEIQGKNEVLKELFS